MRPYQLQGLNWMVSLHHNGLNGILADEMVRPNLIYTPSMTYKPLAGPRKNSTVHLVPCLPQALSRHRWSISCRCSKIHSTKLGSRIQTMEPWFQSRFVGRFQGRTSGNNCQSAYISRLRGLRNDVRNVSHREIGSQKVLVRIHLNWRGASYKNVDSILSQIVRTFTSRGRSRGPRFKTVWKSSFPSSTLSAPRFSSTTRTWIAFYTKIPQAQKMRMRRARRSSRHCTKSYGLSFSDGSNPTSKRVCYPVRASLAAKFNLLTLCIRKGDQHLRRAHRHAAKMVSIRFGKGHWRR